MALSLEERVLIALVRTQVTGEKLILPVAANKVDWRAVMRESVQQAVALLAYESVSEIYTQLPEDIYEEWTQIAFAVLSNNAQVSFSQDQLVAWLEGRNYPYVILKGLTAAADYLRPDLRTLGDVDFLIDPQNQTEIQLLLESHGYTASDSEHSCHVAFKNGSSILEMHFEIAGIPFGEKGEWVRAVMMNALQTSRTISLDGQAFSALDELRHGLVLLLHMQGHMLGEGVGLRHLCDWACFVQKTVDKAYWKNDFLPFLEKLGLLYYACSMTRTASLYLGIRCPDWADSIPDGLCAAIMDDIFASGNFGKKDRTRARSGMMISQHGREGTGHGKLYNLFHTLHSSTAEVYPSAKNSPVLHCALDITRACRFLYLSLIGKRPSLSKMLPKANERKSLYDQLHIFE